jgi:hypothetical protein
MTLNDSELWEAFAQAALPEKEWTHRAHLRMAWLFSARYPLDEAHVLIRVGIIRLNAAQGLVETPARGYHETITRVWLVLMRALMKEVPAKDSLDLIERCADRLGKDALLRHYSRERINGVEARARFVEPDLLPLPTVS